MSEERMRPGWTFWTVVALFAVLVGYPLSFGPACWIISRMHSRIPVAELIYRPVIWAWINSPSPIQKAGIWYASLAAQDTVWAGELDNGKPVLFFIRRGSEHMISMPK